MIERKRFTIGGTVQGVGFRPFVYRLAVEMNLGGWVANTCSGAAIEIEAHPSTLEIFLRRLQEELPPHAVIDLIETEPLTPSGECDFHIRHSDSHDAKTAFILPDLAVCPDCLREMHDPGDRRYRYPFTNCTHCGPRYSIIQALPYDRTNTTMRVFPMCDACRAEYENPLDRRFHAQPIACPVCGPQLALWDRIGNVLNTRDYALGTAAAAIRNGQIVAMKGLGGFHLVVDARNHEAVTRLRTRKHRYGKPLAVMFPSLESIEQCCQVSPAERELLLSSAASIVLLRYTGNEVAPSVAPDNLYLGAMLPYTPFHYLLLEELNFPVIATSGNPSGEPICTDENEALAQLGDIADLFLVHNRPIARPVDDSVVFAVQGEIVTVRRARGYAPQPINVPGADSIIAVGAHQKNAIAVARHQHVFMSQHIGDIENAAAFHAFERTLTDLQGLYDLHPSVVACDLHPDYRSSQAAEQSGLNVIRVQHHYAHVLSCMAEQGLDGPVLGVAWDGTGYGTDGTIWGGEFLRVDSDGFTRVAHLRPFPLQGGDAAAREPRRSALGVLYALFGRNLPRERLAFSPAELDILLLALERHINAPLTSSMGRLFDAVAAIVGLRQVCDFEGQAAMALEFAGFDVNTDECYPFEVTPITVHSGLIQRIIEWKPMMLSLLDEPDISFISAKFHNTLAAMIVRLAQLTGEENVVLTGGCFQNRMLLEKTISELRRANFTPWWNQRIPSNDGGIAFGQIAAAARQK